MNFFLNDNLLAIQNSSKKLLQWAWQLFITKRSFKIKIDLDPLVKLKGLGIQCTHNIQCAIVLWSLGVILGNMFHLQG